MGWVEKHHPCTHSLISLSLVGMGTAIFRSIVPTNTSSGPTKLLLLIGGLS